MQQAITCNIQLKSTSIYWRMQNINILKDAKPQYLKEWKSSIFWRMQILNIFKMSPLIVMILKDAKPLYFETSSIIVLICRYAKT